ncbi:MAG: hypothetical protein Q8M65_06030 [Rhodoglobus sp.]|nr:hypothetical protein [Rhodoglobus sp.]
MRPERDINPVQSLVEDAIVITAFGVAVGLKKSAARVHSALALRTRALC